MKSTLRAVYDCVVYAQALIHPDGPAAFCVEQAIAGAVELHFSQYVIDEILRLPVKLARKYGVTYSQAEELIDALRRHAIFTMTVPKGYVLADDPDDSHYIDLAIATDSTLIISRDKHLLRLMDASRAQSAAFQEQFPNLRILTPTELAQSLRTGTAK